MLNSVFLSPGFTPTDANPTGLRFEPLSLTSIKLTWTNSPYDCDVTAHQVVYVQNINPRFIRIDEPTIEEVIVEGLVADTLYYFSISAVQIGDVVIPSPAIEVIIPVEGKIIFSCLYLVKTSGNIFH